MKRFVVLGLMASLAASAFGQLANSAVIQSRIFNDDSDSTFTSVNAYPTVYLSDLKVDGDGVAPDGANRHAWRFANNGTVLTGNVDTFFDASFDMRLGVSMQQGARKEGGFLLTTDIAGEGQFLVSPTGGAGNGEVAVFGGPLPFYSFTTTNGTGYMNGDLINLRMRYFRDSSDNLRKIEYFVNGVSSGAKPFTNLEQGIPGNWTLGGYLQVNVQQGDPLNFGTAAFTNARLVPEPATIAAFVIGFGGLVARRRKA